MIEGSAWGMWPTVATPAALRPANQETAMPAADDRQRRRRVRPERAPSGRAAPGRRPDGQREARLRQMLHEAQEVAEKALLGDVDAEQLRHLVEHDHQADARLEAGEHRRRR